MLEKILKIIDIIKSCKFLHQLEQTIEIINNFERDEKPLDSRIVEGLLKYYRIKESELVRKSNLKPKKMPKLELNNK